MGTNHTRVEGLSIIGDELSEEHCRLVSGGVLIVRAILPVRDQVPVIRTAAPYRVVGDVIRASDSTTVSFN